MDGNSFWLIYIQDNSVTVSLASNTNNSYRILGTGPSVEWDFNTPDSLIKSTDESLSAASLNANILEDQEPTSAAFVVPPFWVGSDSKIVSHKIKLIKDICKSLSLQPSGFLAEDESIVEDANSADGFPASFILLHLSSTDFYISLVYLGHIKERIRKSLDNEFTCQILESTLVELNSDSALPPQILVFGQADENTVTLLKEFPWVGKKNIETFLHFPEIKLLDQKNITNIFTKIISSQINPNLKLDQDDMPVPPRVEVESLIETDPNSLGFSDSPLVVPEPNLDPFEPPVLPPPIPEIPVIKNKKSFNIFKKIKLPKLKFKFKPNILLWLVLIILPLLFLVPFFLLKSEIILFINPYKFEKTVPITLKVDGDPNEISQSIIPVQKKSFEVKSTATISTTGQKTIGEKAKGEIIIFNKVDKTQNIPKGAILTDSSGKKFELTTAISIAASSSNLDQGVITLGQTKTVAMAIDIGSEYNIDANTQLIFKDFADTILIAKTENSFTGGNRQQIKAVSKEDKANVQSKINQEVEKDVESMIKNDLGNTTGIIDKTIQTQKSNLELSREVGEQADELKGTINASATVFILTEDIKSKVINHFLSSEPDFNNVEVKLSDYTLSFVVDKIDTNKATGKLTITGKSLPKIDLVSIKKNLIGKTITNSHTIIRKLIPRAYNFQINHNFFVLPFRPENIDIVVKIESL